MIQTAEWDAVIPHFDRCMGSMPNTADCRAFYAVGSQHDLPLWNAAGQIVDRQPYVVVWAGRRAPRSRTICVYFRKAA